MAILLDVIKNKKKFAILFFIIALIDVIVKHSNFPIWPYYYISQLHVLLFLILYYYCNRETQQRFFSWTMLSLFCFFIADLLIINSKSIYFLGTSIAFYTLAKLFLSFRFSHQYDFKISRLIPFSIIVFIYTVGLVLYVYDLVGIFFLPMIISYFTTLLLCQFAYLRKGVVDEKSYFFVFSGVIFYMISEGVTVLKIVEIDVPYQDYILMFFYAIGLYLIVHGILIEKKRA